MDECSPSMARMLYECCKLDQCFSPLFEMNVSLDVGIDMGVKFTVFRNNHSVDRTPQKQFGNVC